MAVLAIYLYGFNGNMELSKSPSAIRWMAARWSADVAADMSFGWLIPLVSLYALWLRRKLILAVETAPDWRGISLVIVSLALYWAGVQGQQTRLTLLSLVLLLWSTPFAYFGWPVARLLVFPCFYLIFCIPMSFLDSLTFPLRMFASMLSAGILNGLGIATLRTGTAFHCAGYSFEVDDPCSGLRSVLVMTSLTVAYAFFTQKGRIRQLLLFLSAFPLAVAGNILRIVMVGVVAFFFGQESAMGYYHDYSGYVFFFAAIGLMVMTASLINKDWKTAWTTLLTRLRAGSPT
jgi:exosortase